MQEVIASTNEDNLIDEGLSQDEARYYHERVQHGAALLTIRADAGRADEAHAILQRLGAHDYHTRPSS